jgi:hypothetical protein
MGMKKRSTEPKSHRIRRSPEGTLILSLEKPDASLQAAWLNEAKDRLAAYRSGDLAAMDADRIFEELGKRT